MYFRDPITKQKSVSLTLLWITFYLAVGFSITNVLNLTKDPGPLMELFYSCAALYLGRRLSFGGKVFAAESQQQNNGEENK